MRLALAWLGVLVLCVVALGIDVAGYLDTPDPYIARFWVICGCHAIVAWIASMVTARTLWL